MNLLYRFLSLFRPKSDLYVLGSSILWGQGHFPIAKIDTKIARFIESEFEERPYVHLLAHSGAVLTGDPKFASSPVSGEVPCPWPSVLAQVKMAPAPRSGRIRILIEGGINDVGGVRISSPTTSRDFIERATERACYHTFKEVLGALFARFPEAEVYVLGYYQILADRAGRKDVEEMLNREGISPIAADDDFDLAETAIANTRIFRERSDYWLRKASEEISTKNSGTCTFVSSGIDEKEGIFGKPSLLFHPWSNDPMMGKRARQCTIALARGQTGLHCYLAATAHPNEDGIDRYVAGLVSALKSRWTQNKDR